MCCIVTNFLRIVVLFCSVWFLFVLNFTMLWDLNELFKGRPAKYAKNYYTICNYHCWCGTLLVVLKLKDLCFLHWWLLFTSGLIIGGIGITLMQPESDDFDMGDKLSNYFVLEFMLVTIFTVAIYTRTLRAEQEE